MRKQPKDVAPNEPLGDMLIRKEKELMAKLVKFQQVVVEQGEELARVRKAIAALDPTSSASSQTPAQETPSS